MVLLFLVEKVLEEKGAARGTPPTRPCFPFCTSSACASVTAGLHRFILGRPLHFDLKAGESADEAASETDRT